MFLSDQLSSCISVLLSIYNYRSPFDQAQVLLHSSHEVVRLNEFVNPNKPIANYRPGITGITAGDLDGVSCSLADVQMSMKKLLSYGIILIGHSLHNDLRALKTDHARVIGTSYVFKYRDQPSNRRLSSSNLCQSVLGFELRKKDSPHNYLDDACTAMKLVLAKIERGVDCIIPLVREEVQEPKVEKLFVHKIPVAVHSEELHKVIPGDFTIVVKIKNLKSKEPILEESVEQVEI